MILIIGGAFQGKTEYVKNHFGVKIEEIYDACIPENTDGEHVCINHLHEYIKAQLKEGNYRLRLLAGEEGRKAVLVPLEKQNAEYAEMLRNINTVEEYHQLDSKNRKQ